MSNVVKAAIPVAKISAIFVSKNWKNIASGFALVATFLKDHPEVPAWFQARLVDVQRKVEEALTKRDPAEQIVGVLRVVREQAQANGDAFNGKRWVDRADSIERDLPLAEVQSSKGRKATLARLKGETADLLAALLLASASSRAEQDDVVARPRDEDPSSV